MCKTYDNAPASPSSVFVEPILYVGCNRGTRPASLLSAAALSIQRAQPAVLSIIEVSSTALRLQAVRKTQDFARNSRFDGICRKLRALS